MARIIIQLGQIWKVKFPFSEDPTKFKLRPAAIVGWSQKGHDQDFKILVAAITSHNEQPEKARKGEIPISNASSIGLSKESFVRARMLFSIDPSILESENPLGTLSDDDLIKVLETIGELFQTPGSIETI